MDAVSTKKLTWAQMNLIEQAYGMLEYSLNPFGLFYAGAAVRCQSDGAVYTGCLVENPLGMMSAEESALAAAFGKGRRHFDSIAIVAGYEPCDAERAVPRMYEPKDMRLADGSGRVFYFPDMPGCQAIFTAADVSCRNLEVLLSTTALSSVVVTSAYELLPGGQRLSEPILQRLRTVKQVFPDFLEKPTG